MSGDSQLRIMQSASASPSLNRLARAEHSEDVQKTVENVTLGHRVFGSCGSRSTSAGSTSSPAKSADDGDVNQSYCATRGSAPVVVRNTFIDIDVGRPASLEGFLHEREVRSCPCSRAESFDDFGLSQGFLRFLENEHETHMAAPAQPWDQLATLNMDEFATLSDALPQIPNSSEMMPVVVRNTFIDAPVGRPVSLDDFFHERDIRSCPVSRVVSIDNVGALSSPEGILSLTTKASPAGAMGLVGCADLLPAFALETNLPSDCLGESAPPFKSQVPVLSLASALAEHEVSFQQLSTLGSSGHGYGVCKPCAFVHTKGCGNGVQCPFCHLCAPDERKRRKQEKKEVRKERRRNAQRLN